MPDAPHLVEMPAAQEVVAANTSAAPEAPSAVDKPALGADQPPPPNQRLCRDLVGKTRRVGGNLSSGEVRDTEGIVEIINHSARQTGSALLDQTTIGPVEQHRDNVCGGSRDDTIGVAGRDFHPDVLTAGPGGRNRATVR